MTVPAIIDAKHVLETNEIARAYIRNGYTVSLFETIEGFVLRYGKQRDVYLTCMDGLAAYRSCVCHVIESSGWLIYEH